MKLAVSNIAWRPDEDDRIYSLLRKEGISALEIAPARFFSNPYERTPKEIKTLKVKLLSQGFNIVSLQALLYGRPDLMIFKDKNTRLKTLNYLKTAVDFALYIGAGKVVFGSPKNRLIGNLNKQKVLPIALDFFSELGDYAVLKNVDICLEANPSIFGCDFLTSTFEALEFICLVNKKNLKVNFDTGTVMQNHEDLKLLLLNINLVGHVHFSIPNLDAIEQKHQKSLGHIYDYLNQLGYSGHYSIEMKSQTSENNIKQIAKAIKIIKQILKKNG